VNESVSVLFSEPKIPQLVSSSCSTNLRSAFQCSSASRKFLNAPYSVDQRRAECVSVLFSEPKIPQGNRRAGFARSAVFQCSSASRKFLNV